VQNKQWADGEMTIGVGIRTQSCQPTHASRAFPCPGPGVTQISCCAIGGSFRSSDQNMWKNACFVEDERRKRS